MKVLIVEDDSRVSGFLDRGLKAEGYRTQVAGTAQLGLTMAKGLQAEVTEGAGDAMVILDVMLPDGSGLDVCQTLRKESFKLPVLMLTALNTVDDRIVGLRMGADDYLGKPFELPELEARLRALVRRAQGTGDQVNVGRLKLDRKARRMSMDDVLLELPAREFEVLWELMSPPGRVVSKRELSGKLSDTDEALGDNALESFISRLRKKLAGSGAGIRTLRGIGYLLEAQA